MLNILLTKVQGSVLSAEWELKLTFVHMYVSNYTKLNNVVYIIVESVPII